MIVNYIHVADPTTIRVYNTELALKNNPFIEMSQQDFDKLTLRSLSKDKKRGVILSYSVVKE